MEMDRPKLLNEIICTFFIWTLKCTKYLQHWYISYKHGRRLASKTKNRNFHVSILFQRRADKTVNFESFIRLIMAAPDTLRAMLMWSSNTFLIRNASRLHLVRCFCLGCLPLSVSVGWMIIFCVDSYSKKHLLLLSTFGGKLAVEKLLQRRTHFETHFYSFHRNTKMQFQESDNRRKNIKRKMSMN